MLGKLKRRLSDVKMSRMKEHKLEHYFDDHHLVSPLKEMVVNSKSY